MRPLRGCARGCGGRLWVWEPGAQSRAARVDATDEMNVDGQMCEDALAAVETVGGDDKGAVGESVGDPAEEFQGQFRPCLMQGAIRTET